MCQPRHRHSEWLKFLLLIDRRTPKHLSLHLVVENYAAQPPEVQKWLARHPRFVMHFMLTSASWMNMVERFVRDITDKRIRREASPAWPNGNWPSTSSTTTSPPSRSSGPPVQRTSWPKVARAKAALTVAPG